MTDGRGSLVYLLVEDNPGDVLLIRELVEDVTTRVEHVTSCTDCGPVLASGTIDVVLLDLGLPDAQGTDCVTRLLAWSPHMAIVVLTGRNDMALGLACLKAGACDYLPKQDLRSDTLQRAIAFALARSREAQAKRQSAVLEGRMEAIVNASSDLIISTDLQGRIETWNGGAERLLGLNAAQVLGRLMSEVWATPKEGSWEYVGTISGRDCVLSTFGALIRTTDGTPIGLATIGHDITLRRRREAELALRDRQLSALAARLAEVRETERTQLSRKVHDEVGQLMTGIKMDLRWILRRLTPESTQLEPVIERVQETDQLLDRALVTVRDIALELRPSALDALGLAAAVRDEIRRFEQRSQLVFEVDAQPAEPEPPAEVATALFRVLQELLTNIARHAQASRGAVRLSSSPGDWQLLVEDDGVGFSATAKQRLTSLGLVGVRERAAKFGGSLELSQSTLGGPAVCVRIPRQRSE